MTPFWSTAFGRDERGSVAVWMAGGFAAIMGVGAIAMDLGHVYVEEQRLQSTADIAVLAASKAFEGGGDVTATALDYVEKNMPSAKDWTRCSRKQALSGARRAAACAWQ